MALAVSATPLKIAGSGQSTNGTWTVGGGNLLVAFVSTFGGDNTLHAVSGATQGNFTKIGGADNGTNPGEQFSMWYKVNSLAAVNETFTFDGGTGANGCTAIIHEVTGADPTAPFTAGEFTTSLVTTTTNPRTLTVTNSIANSIFFAGLTNDDSHNPATLTVNSTGSTHGTWALKDATNSQQTDNVNLQDLSVPFVIVATSASTVHGWTTGSGAGVRGQSAFRIVLPGLPPGLGPVAGMGAAMRADMVPILSY